MSTTIRGPLVYRALKLFCVALLAPAGLSAMSAEVRSSVGPIAPVGTIVRWSASPIDAMTDDIWYRFRLRRPDAPDFQMAVDFNPRNTFDWVPIQPEGLWELEVTARDRTNNDEVVTTASFHVSARVVDNQPVLTPTENELIYIYSAPPCPEGSNMQVQFDAPDGFRQSTPAAPCAAGMNMNSYIAGLRPSTDYRLRHVITSDSGVTTGPELTFTTGPLSIQLASTVVLQHPPDPMQQGILLQSKVFEYNVATDFTGNVVWFCPQDIRYLTRPEAGGYFLAIVGAPGAAATDQLLRQIDLGGHVMLETSVARVNEQLAVLGDTRITSFHHEAKRLPNGGILVLAGTERILNNVQGAGDVDVIGDVILALGPDLQVQWVWDAFNHLDPGRAAVLGETCVAGGGGCPEFYLADTANDWLHGNALQLTGDGNILYSARHQDWIIKIDFRNGEGSGDVIWRLGKGGDFAIESSDANPWFSHQHDANFELDGTSSRLVVFDNGNTRNQVDPEANSRGQVLEIDEGARTARLVMNVDLGTFSTALGSAQRLTNGNYMFDIGWMPDTFSQTVEYDSGGSVVSRVQVSTQQYRSFRMQDMYTP